MKYLLKAVYEKTNSEGKITISKEQYLCESETFGNAEEKGYLYIQPFLAGQQKITHISEYKVNELVGDEGDKYFRVKINYLEDDEKGKEKKIPAIIIVLAWDITEAKSAFDEYMKTCSCDFKMVRIEETEILDIIL